jgi:hypothetical protein
MILAKLWDMLIGEPLGAAENQPPNKPVHPLESQQGPLLLLLPSSHVGQGGLKWDFGLGLGMG